MITGARLCGAGIALLLAPGLAYANDVAVVVGVSDYKAFAGPDRGDLKYADADARLFAETLKTSLGFASKDVIVLTSDGAGQNQSSAANILRALKSAAAGMKDARNGKFVFYFSGHGVGTGKGPLLAACDFDPAKPFKGDHDGLRAQGVSAWLSSLNVGFTLAIFDICRPGDAGKQGIYSQFGIRPGGAKNTATIYSSVEGPSYESDVLHHGYFTHYLCKALRPVGTGRMPVVGAMDENGNITLDGLQRYIRSTLPEATQANAVAVPQSPSNSDGGLRGAYVGLGQSASFEFSGQAMTLPLAHFDFNKVSPGLSARTRRSVQMDNGAEAFEKGQALGPDAKEGRRYFLKAGMYFADAFDLHAFPDEAQNAYAAFASACAYMKAKSDEDAKDMFRSTIKSDPKFGIAMVDLGYMLAAEGDADAAEAQYRAAIAADPTMSLAMFNLAVVMEDQHRDYAEAARLYRAAIAANPKDVPSMVNLGLLLSGVFGKPEEAEKAYQAALAVDPKCTSAMVDYGLLLDSNGDKAGAERQYRAAIAVDPAYASAHNNLGLILVDKKAFSEAKSHFLAVIQAKPTVYECVQARISLGWIYANQDHKVKEAKEQYQVALDLEPKNATALSNLGAIYEDDEKDFDKAKAYYLQAIAADNDYVDAHYNLGHLLENAFEDFAGAEAQYRKCLDLQPGEGLYHADLASAFLGQGKRAEALAEAAMAKKLNLKEHPVYKRLGMEQG